MPLITQEMINSLKGSDGKYSRHALYLLGAIPKPTHRECPLKDVEPAADWQKRVLCNKINGRQVMAITAAAKELKKKALRPEVARAPKAGQSDARPFNTLGVHPKYLRRLRRKLVTQQKRQLAIVDEILQEAVQASKRAKAA